MNKIDRYIAKVVLASTGIVLIVLLGVQSFVQLAAQLQDVGKGDYFFSHAILFVPLMLPSDIYQLFPMAALIGCLLGLGRLTDSSELVVMRASGLSLLRIVKSVVISTGILLVLVTVIGEVIAPKARDIALTMKKTALSNGQMIQTGEGIWLRDHNRFVHFTRIENRHQLTGVILYEFDAHNRLAKFRSASSADWDKQKKEWNFNDVRISTLTSNKIITEQINQETWPVHIDTKLMVLSEIDPNQQTLLQLYHYMTFRQHSGFGQGIFAFVFWKRIFQPLASLVMIFLAIPFILGPASRSTKGGRIIIGILVGFAFYIMNQFFGPLSQVYQIPAMYAALLPTALCGVLGFILLRRVTYTQHG